MDITQFSKQQLEQELARREEAARQEALSLREQGFAMLLKHREALLELIPHGRSSCSDADPSNGLYSASYGPRCARCGLLELDEYSYERHDFTLTLNILEIKPEK